MTRKCYSSLVTENNRRDFDNKIDICSFLLNYDWKGGIIRRSIKCSEQNRVLWTKWKNNEYRTLQYIYTGFLKNRDRSISYRERSLFVQRPLFCSESTTFQSKRRTSKSCSLISSEWIGKKAKTRCRTRKVVLLYNLQ